MACPEVFKIVVNSAQSNRTVGDILQFRVILNNAGIGPDPTRLSGPCRAKCTYRWSVTLNGSPCGYIVSDSHQYVAIAHTVAGTYRASVTVTQPGNPQIFSAWRELDVPGKGGGTKG